MPSTIGKNTYHPIHGSSDTDSIENFQSTALLKHNGDAGDKDYSQEGHEENDPLDSIVQDYRRNIRRLSLILLCQTIISLIVVGLGLAYFAREWWLDSKILSEHSKSTSPQLLYSPVQHLIEYQTKVFHEGFGADRSIYQLPPSPEVDAAWEDLYNFGVSRITKEEASQLVNHTYRLPGDEDHYVIQLDVFHQLHCLNMLRKSLNPEYYNKLESNNHEHKHWGHCIESIRQSLMCSADVSPLVWQWVEKKKGVRIMGNIIHTCRDYEKIKEWGLERRLDHELDFTGFM